MSYNTIQITILYKASFIAHSIVQLWVYLLQVMLLSVFLILLYTSLDNPFLPILGDVMFIYISRTLCNSNTCAWNIRFVSVTPKIVWFNAPIWLVQFLEISQYVPQWQYGECLDDYAIRVTTINWCVIHLSVLYKFTEVLVRKIKSVARVQWLHWMQRLPMHVCWRNVFTFTNNKMN